MALDIKRLIELRGNRRGLTVENFLKQEAKKNNYSAERTVAALGLHFDKDSRDKLDVICKEAKAKEVERQVKLAKAKSAEEVESVEKENKADEAKDEDEMNRSSKPKKRRKTAKKLDAPESSDIDEEDTADEKAE